MFILYSGVITVVITGVIITVLAIVGSIFLKRYFKTLADEIIDDSKKLLSQIKKS